MARYLNCSERDYAKLLHTCDVMEDSRVDYTTSLDIRNEETLFCGSDLTAS